MSEWFGVARDVVMFTVALLVFYWGRDRKASEDAVDAKIQRATAALESDNAVRINEIADIERQIERLRTRGEQLMEQIPVLYLPRHEAERLLEESRRERQETKADARELREELRQLRILIDRRYGQP